MHFEAGKIFAEYDFRYFRCPKVVLVQLLTLVGDFPKEEGTWNLATILLANKAVLK